MCILDEDLRCWIEREYCFHSSSPVQLTLVSTEACTYIFDRQRTLHTSKAYVRHTSDNLLPRASLRN